MPSLFDFPRRTLLALGLMALPFSAQAADSAIADIVGPGGEALGVATMTQWPAGVLVEVRVSGLEPGEHGVHIHETGACGADFAAAGGHFNPAGRGHGFSTVEGPHGGDLPNIFVGANGGAVAHFLTDRITLTDGLNSLFDADGAALIIHAKADTYAADAGAGSRVACGVIRPVF